MITKVVIESFKRFSQQEFTLSESVVLAGPNNTGKSTLLQALATWSMTLERWRFGKGRVTAGKDGKPKPRTAKMRTGQPVTRKDFTAIPLREFNLLWYETRLALLQSELESGQKAGEPRLIHITVHGATGLTQAEPWSLTMELRYQSTELIYVKPLGLGDTDIPQQALDLSIVHCPPFSGIGAEEKRMDQGAQNLEIGRGKSGDILRNLLLEVSHQKGNWDALVADIEELFGLTLEKPVYDEALPFILCEYLGGIATDKKGGRRSRFDIASGGSGFHQVLLLLSFFYARPASVFLLDEPDAHLHVILQRQIHDRLRQVASRRDCQLIIATHSEVILDATPPSRVISFFSRPHPLVRPDQRDQVREAMSRLTTLDLLLAEEGRAILYCEGSSDFDILQAWAEVLKHPAKRFFSKPFFHVNEGRNPREARGHLFALHAIHPSIRGLLLLDGDNRGLPDHELAADDLTIIRWHRYEIENYLVVPDVIGRIISPDPENLFRGAAMHYLRTQSPLAVFSDPLADSPFLDSVPASKELLPRAFEAAGRPLEKGEFFLIAQNMKPEEIHPEVIRVLDAIARLLPPESSEPE